MTIIKYADPKNFFWVLTFSFYKCNKRLKRICPSGDIPCIYPRVLMCRSQQYLSYQPSTPPRQFNVFSCGNLSLQSILIKSTINANQQRLIAAFQSLRRTSCIFADNDIKLLKETRVLHFTLMSPMEFTNCTEEKSTL